MILSFDGPTGVYRRRRTSRSYPPNWTPQFKTRIRKRDGLRCAICEKRARLDVHHIDYTHRTVPANCISLCRSCHSSIHASRKVDKLFWERHLGILARQREGIFR